MTGKRVCESDNDGDPSTVHVDDDVISNASSSLYFDQNQSSPSESTTHLSLSYGSEKQMINNSTKPVLLHSASDSNNKYEINTSQGYVRNGSGDLKNCKGGTDQNHVFSKTFGKGQGSSFSILSDTGSFSAMPAHIFRDYNERCTSPKTSSPTSLRKINSDEQMFQRKSSKYCANIADLHFLEKLIATNVKVLSVKKDSGKTKSLQKVTSVYLDTFELELCKSKLAKIDGAILIRIRWYGNACHEEDELGEQIGNGDESSLGLFVERKTYHTPESGKKSVKERFPISQRNLIGYLRGEWTGTNNRSEILAAEIQETILSKKLKPRLGTQYVRRQFQSEENKNIRVTVDNDVWMAVKDGSFENILHNNDYKVLEGGLATKFPYGIIEVKLKGAGNDAQDPEWMSKLIESNIIKKVPVSKYAFGCGVLYHQVMPAMPKWFTAVRDVNFLGVNALASAQVSLPSLAPLMHVERQQSCPIRAEIHSSPKNPFIWHSMEMLNDVRCSESVNPQYFSCADADSLKCVVQEHFARSASNDIQQGCSFSFKMPPQKVSQPSPSPAQQPIATSDTKVTTKSVPAAVLKDPKDTCAAETFKKSRIASSVKSMWSRVKPSRSCQNPSVSMTRPHRLIQRSKPAQNSKIEPKTYLANERTFLGWISIGMTIATFSIALMDFGGHSSFISGCIYTPISIVFMVYGLFMFNRRGKQIKNRYSGAFDDRFGPCVLVFLLIVTVIVNLVVVIHTRNE